jgi:outer membrane immunogenic protein
LQRSEDVQYLGTVRARLGYLVTDNVLLFGTAGLAWERVDRTEFLTGNLVSATLLTTVPTNLFGWVVGIGAEARLGSTYWFGRLEYLHYDFGQIETFGSVNNGPTSPKGQETIDVIRGAVSYKF